MESKKLSDTHLQQIKSIISQINSMKTELADHELMKMDLITKIQQNGMNLNNLINQFPALYNVPQNSQLDLDRGIIMYDTSGDTQAVPINMNTTEKSNN